MKRPVKLSVQGFTIIELMIATTVFSLVLLLCAAGLIQIGRTYNKGLTTNKTQATARSLIEEISRAIQFSGGAVATTPTTRTPGVPYVFCVDDKRYTVLPDKQLKDSPADNTQSKYAVVSDTFAGCSASSPPAAVTDNGFNISSLVNGRELLAPNMRIARLEVNSKPNNLYEVIVRVVYGDEDLLDNSHSNCRNVKAGTQFCAVSELSTVVEKRL